NLTISQSSSAPRCHLDERVFNENIIRRDTTGNFQLPRSERLFMRTGNVEAGEEKSVSGFIKRHQDIKWREASPEL
ncbi:hypothetical protein M9458_009923, partial [Cirrhinus mrigala]